MALHSQDLETKKDVVDEFILSLGKPPALAVFVIMTILATVAGFTVSKGWFAVAGFLGVVTIGSFIVNTMNVLWFNRFLDK